MRMPPLLSHKLKIGARIKHQVDLNCPQSPVPIDGSWRRLIDLNYRTAGSYNSIEQCRSPPSGRCPNSTKIPKHGANATAHGQETRLFRIAMICLLYLATPSQRFSYHFEISRRVATNATLIFCFVERWLLCATTLIRNRATRTEVATRRWIQRAWNFATEHNPLALTVPGGFQHGRNQ